MYDARLGYMVKLEGLLKLKDCLGVMAWIDKTVMPAFLLMSKD